jgi:hypothetical protein
MASKLVNKHITRVLAAGAVVGDIDTAWLASVDSWMSGQGLIPNLVSWVSPAFGMVRSGAPTTKIFDLGTTWLPRMGDLTAVSPANTNYSATGLSSKPAITTATAAATFYWGSARNGGLRWNPIRRKHRQGITFAGVYQKTHANITSLFGLGQFGGMYLQNTAGSPGSAKMFVGGWGNAWSVADTHGTTLANSAVHVIGGTFDGTTATAYVEGVAGSGAGPATQDNAPLLGGVTFNDQQYCALYAGSQTSHVALSASSTIPTFDGASSHSQFTWSDLICFDTALTPTQMASLNTLLRTRY